MPPPSSSPKLECPPAGQSAPFQKCIDAFRAHAEGEGWIAAGASFKLVFDGERVQPDQTPEGLDCDDGDVIDVHC